MNYYELTDELIKETGIDNDLSTCLEYNGQEFDILDIEKVLAVHEGEKDRENWQWVIQLKEDSVKEKHFDGEFVYLMGGCDFTGWDCQSWARSKFSTTAIGACGFAEPEEIFNELLSQLETVKQETWREKKDIEFGLRKAPNIN